MKPVKKSGRKRAAIWRRAEDIQDTHLARRRLARGGRRVTLEALEKKKAQKR